MNANLWLIAWAIVVIEIVSPVPLALSLGAIYVLLVRPAWFADFVDRLYERR